MARSIKTNRVVLLLVGVFVAIFITLQTRSLDQAAGNRFTTQKAGNEKTLLILLPDILSQSKKIINIIRSFERQ